MKTAIWNMYGHSGNTMEKLMVTREHDNGVLEPVAVIDGCGPRERAIAQRIAEHHAQADYIAFLSAEDRRGAVLSDESDEYRRCILWSVDSPGTFAIFREDTLGFVAAQVPSVAATEDEPGLCPAIHQSA